MTSQLPPPDSGEDFEKLCRDLWQAIWRDPNTLENGRSGQAQDGVDLFGRIFRPDGTWQRQWGGVQCKKKGFGKKVSAKELRKEVEAAKDFNPSLDELILATTAPRDAKLQEVARQITDEHAERGVFSVTVFAWEDISRELLKRRELLRHYYSDFVHDPEDLIDPEDLQERYLRSLWRSLKPLTLMGISGRGADVEIPLVDVYTALDLDYLVGAQPNKGPGNEWSLVFTLKVEGELDFATEIDRSEVEQRASKFRRLPNRARMDDRWPQRLLRRLQKEAETRPKWQQEQLYQRRLGALEGAAANPRLVLLGGPGSGKSTFLRYLALCLAGAALGQEKAGLHRLEQVGSNQELPPPQDRRWPHGCPLPLFVELRQWVRSEAFPAEGERGCEEHLLAYLAEDLPAGDRKAFHRLLLDALASEAGAILLLDGLDETPRPGDVRERIRRAVHEWVERFPGCRVLVTSRPYAYEHGDAWRLDSDGFHVERLAPFDVRQRKAFIEGWYACLAEKRQVDSKQAPRQAKDLARQVGSTPYLEPLAERPILLTLMTELHAANGRLPEGGRAALYEESVKLLLDRWNQSRGLENNENLSDQLGLTAGEMRRALEGLAYDIHRSRGEAGSKEAANIPIGDVLTALNAQRSADPKKVVDPGRLAEYLHQRSGILVAESADTYRFPHRSFQEYLAACQACRQRKFRRDQGLVAEALRDPALWREVVLMMAGKHIETPFMQLALFGALTGGPPKGRLKRTEPRFEQAILAGLAVEELELWRSAEDGELEEVRQWMEKIVIHGALSAVDRAAAGRVLGHLGDRRRGVGLGRDGLPRIEWRKVPAGPFLMGDEKKRQECATFEIGKFPVTNAQYQVFIDDGGYRERWRHSWEEAEGWERFGNEGPEGFTGFDISNHPRVGVSWYEAMAFCRWLGERRGEAIRLPTALEWEKAARGEDGRTYPWGEGFEDDRCNSAQTTGMRRTCAVGLFPGGRSPYGLMDMAGNVWDWTVSEEEGGEFRISRGGCWAIDARGCRAACRFWRHPADRDGDLGFRLVRT